MLRRALVQLVGSSSSQRLGFSTAASAAAASTSTQELDFAALYKLVKEQPTPSPQRPFKFLQLFAKASSVEQAQEALSLLERDRQLRSKAKIHTPYNPHISALLLQMLRQHGTPDMLVSALEQAHVLGLQHPKRALAKAMRRLSRDGDLRSMEMVYLLSLLSMDRPSKDMLFVAIKAFSAAGQPAKVQEYAAEARRLGVNLPPAALALLEAPGSGDGAQAAGAMQ